MKCEVYAQLHGATQVQRDDVLRINVLGELTRRCRAACLYSRDTAPQQFKLRAGRWGVRSRHQARELA